MATCTQCGAELKPGTKFCENCGAKVSVPQPAAQPAAVPQPPVQLYPGCAATPTACTDAPQPQAGGGNPYTGGAPAGPAAPDERSESLRRQCARHTAADRRKRTALRQKHTRPSTPPDAPHAITPPPPGGTGGNPYGNVFPGGKAKRPRAPMSPNG